MVSGELVQGSNIYAPPTAASELSKLGTYAYNVNGGTWTDYKTTLTIRSEDLDAVGLMFRYQDPDNYYRFTWNTRKNYRRLEKRVGGTFTLLAADGVPYVQGQSYTLEIRAQGNMIEARIDGEVIFGGPIADSSLTYGSIALYSWGNAGAYFDNVLVENLAE